jgi:signal transduction histidine kinase
LAPYPYNPTFIFLLLFALLFSRFSPIVGGERPGISRFSTAGLVIIFSTIPSVLIALFAYYLHNYRRWSSKNFLYYLIEVSFGESVILLYSRLVIEILNNRFHNRVFALTILSPGVFIGATLLALIALALIHNAERSIEKKLANADDLIAKLEVDRAQLVNDAESMRQQTSRFLHDQVQSELMVIGMKLKTIVGKSSPVVNEEIDLAIASLEKIRATDLKTITQVLAPNFEVGGLSHSLSLLAEQYQSSMEISIDVGNNSEKLESDVLLGIYRIVEQSLLNSLIHGPANRVMISTRTTDDGITEIVVSDDGPGTSYQVNTSGTGTSIIDSWVGILNGRKKFLVPLKAGTT